jgi:hypothetical protein
VSTLTPYDDEQGLDILDWLAIQLAKALTTQRAAAIRPTGAQDRGVVPG